MIIISAVLLFSPGSYLTILGIADIVDKIRSWLGFAFLVSSALLFTIFLFWMKDLLAKKLKGRRELKYARENLRRLSGDEKRFLSDYIIQRNITQNASIGNGVANSLVHKGIIYQPSTVGHLITGIAFNLQPWAHEELNKQPELLEPELSQLKKDMESQRPEF